MARAIFIGGGSFAVLLVVSVQAALAAETAPRFTCGGFVPEPAPTGAGKTVAVAPLGDRVHALVVFADFEGRVNAAEGPPAYAARLFERERAGSLAHFYDLMSFGQFALDGTVLPRRYAAKLRPATADMRPYGHFARDLLAKLDRDVDFGRYDNDGPDGVPNSGDDDGVVDYLFINLRSVPRGFIAGGATGVAGLGFGDAYVTGDTRPDGRPILVGGGRDRGSVVLEGTFGQTVGVMAHEFGHALGLPDLYDLSYEDPESDSAGIGKWGLMGWGAHGWDGAGPVGFSAWSLERLGWVGRGNGRLVEIVRPRDLAAEDLFAGGRIYKVHLPAGRQAVPGSSSHHVALIDPGYLLLEARSRQGHYYNRGLPGEGVLIWHVRPHERSNNDERDKAVDLVSAGGLYGPDGAPVPQAGLDGLDYWAHDAAYRDARGGHRGGAGDLFDGIRRTRFAADTNPAIASVGDFSSSAVSRLSVEVERAGGGLRLRVDPPRWAGAITGEVVWAGTVLVDGDLVIEPGAQLTLMRPTQVRFAAGDRLRAGRDPGLSEVSVRGGFISGGGIPLLADGAVEFAALEPGGEWYGVILEPASGAFVNIAINDVSIRDAREGWVWPGVAPGPPGLAFAGVRVVDDLEDGRAGNGDGRIAPGESVQLVLELVNRSFRMARDVQVRATWDDARLAKTWDGKRSFSAALNAPPGLLQFSLPDLALDARNVSGEPLVLTLQLRHKGRDVWNGPVAVPLAGAGAPRAVAFARGGPAVLSFEERLPVAAVAPVAVESVDLVTYKRETERVIDVAPMTRRGGVFTGGFSPPRVGQYELVLRARDAAGRVFLADRKRVNVPFNKWNPALIVINNNGGQWNETVAELAQDLGARGMPANRLYKSRLHFADPALLTHYAGPDKVVVWLGNLAGAQSSAGLAALLAAGGRLLVSSDYFARRGRDEVLLDYIPAYDHKTSLSPQPLYGQGHLASLEIERAFFSSLTELPPLARPLFLDGEGRPVGLLREADYRLTFYSFDLFWFDAGQRALALDSALDFLLGERGAPQLVIRQVGGVDDLISLAGLAPRIQVANLGGAESAAFSVWYEVRGESGRLVRHGKRQAPLAPGAVREVAMPAWRPPGEGAVQVDFRLRDLSRGDLLDHLGRGVQVVDAEGGFALARLDGGSGNGATFFDYDSDGDLDFYLAVLQGANRLYRNDGGRFAETAAAAGLADEGRGRAAALGDYDSDGDLDLYVVNEAADGYAGGNRFFRNRGDGRFTDATAELDAQSGTGARLGDANSGRSAGFFDSDGDGDLDLYLVNARGGADSANRLYRNDGGRFAETAALVGLADADNGRGLAIGDYDSDGDPDLYVANRESERQDQLFRNDLDGDGRFNRAGIGAGLRYAFFEVGALFGDYDSDGDLDLFIANEGAPSELWHNDGVAAGGRFRPVAAGRLGGRDVGAAFLDYNNDGDLDLATTGISKSAGGEELYHNMGDGRFVAVGDLLGLRGESDGRGLSWGDYDGDGMQDLLVADAGQSALYRNKIAPASWLGVELEGEAGNVDALGARVELSVAGQVQVRELQSSYGYGSQVQPWLHFGLDGADQVDSVRVFWPGGQQSVTTRIGANQRLVLAHPAARAGKASPPYGPGLGRSYPNPFNARAVIPYRMAADGRVRLEVFNVAGQRVRLLLDQVRPAGRYQAVWDGRDGRGRSLGSGVYFYRLQAGGRAESRRMLLLQ